VSDLAPGPAPLPAQQPAVAAQQQASDSTITSDAGGAVYEAVYGKRKVRYYLLSEHELVSLSVTSGGATFSLTIGIFLLGVAATIFFGSPTPLPSAPTTVVSLVLGILLIVVAVILLFVRHGDIDRIKKESTFNQQ
jgi:hypothetical protein